MNSSGAKGIQINPFPGLRPFREDEEHLFFGRESQVDAMVDKLAVNHFLTVVGTSGCGKSSLVNCGLRPALQGGLMSCAGTTWRMAQFRPGNDPLEEMARALARKGVLFRDYQAEGLTLPEIIDTTLRMSKLGLIDIYEQAQLGEGVNLLLVVDQFEELFRYWQLRAAQHEDVSIIRQTATAFVNLLLEAKAQATYPIYIVLTMRSDFLGECSHFPGLAEAINTGQYLVPRMTRDERRKAISGPAEVGGAEITPVLLMRLVNDVGDNPDQLSILQHALNRTWARWQNEGDDSGPLDLTHYQAIGTMAQALDHHAEKAYYELSTARQRELCKKLFKAMTDKSTDSRGVRRPTTLGTLCALANATEAEVTEVIEVFRQPSRSFLMPPAGEALLAEIVIDISHESLMRVWQRLKRWADEESQSAQIYRRLTNTASLHAEEGASLLQDPELQLALDWFTQSQTNETWAIRYHSGFRAAMAFLEESRKAHEAEMKKKEDERSKELEAERQKAQIQKENAMVQARKAKTMRNRAIISVVAFIIALLSTGFAFMAKKEATAQAQRALQALRVAVAWEYTEKDPRISVAFLREVKDPESVRGWRGATGKVLQRSESSFFRKKLQTSSVFTAKFSPDGTRVVTASWNGEAQLWEVATGEAIGEPMRHNGAVLSASFSPDGKRVYTASRDHTARMWDAATSLAISRPLFHGAGVTSISSSPDSLRIVTTSEDGTARFWDVQSGMEISILIGHKDTVSTAEFSTDERFLLNA